MRRRPLVSSVKLFKQKPTRCHTLRRGSQWPGRCRRTKPRGSANHPLISAISWKIRSAAEIGRSGKWQAISITTWSYTGPGIRAVIARSILLASGLHGFPDEMGRSRHSLSDGVKRSALSRQLRIGEIGWLRGFESSAERFENIFLFLVGYEAIFAKKINAFIPSLTSLSRL